MIRAENTVIIANDFPDVKRGKAVVHTTTAHVLKRSASLDMIIATNLHADTLRDLEPNSRTAAGSRHPAMHILNRGGMAITAALTAASLRPTAGSANANRDTAGRLRNSRRFPEQGARGTSGAASAARSL